MYINMEKGAKKVSDSLAEQAHLVMPMYANGKNKLFGAKILEWIDVVGGIVARRHAGCEVTTVCIDRVNFYKSAELDDTIVVKGRITYAGRTSMEIRLEVFKENASLSPTLISEGYAVYAAIDKNFKTIEVPQIQAESEEQAKELLIAKQRFESRKNSR